VHGDNDLLTGKNRLPVDIRVIHVLSFLFLFDEEYGNIWMKIHALKLGVHLIPIRLIPVDQRIGGVHIEGPQGVHMHSASDVTLG